jgi:hypothetical protein
MATTTPQFGWPVPTSTDYVADGAVAIEALGDAIDGRIGDVTNFPNQIVNRPSTTSYPIPFSSSAGNLGNVSLGAGASNNTTVTFATGRFTQTPIIVANAAGDTFANVVGYAAIPSSSSFILVRLNFAGGTQNLAATWIALQMTSTSGAG